MIREAAQQSRVDRAEERRGGAYADGKNQDGYDGEARVLPQSSDRVPDVLKQRVGHRADPPLPHLFLHLLDATEFQPCCSPSLVRAHPRLDLLGRQQLQVARQLLIQVAVQLFLTEERTEGADNPSVRRHGSPLR